MSSIVIAYEDLYCEALHNLVKALRRDRGLPGLCLEPRTVRGTGGFVNEVPKILRMPLKQTKVPPDRVVCVADADRPQNLVPGAPPAPTTGDSEAMATWLSRFEESWRVFPDLAARGSPHPVARSLPGPRKVARRAELSGPPNAPLTGASNRDPPLVAE